MVKINQDFPHDMFKFLHKPIKDGDTKTSNFLERFLLGPQILWEQKIDARIHKIMDLIDPSKTPQPRLLKDHVGFTKELDKVLEGVSDDDLRKIISLAVALWKRKGLEVGYENIIRVFTGANVRIFNWFDFRYIVGEQQMGEQQLGEDSWFISIVGELGSQDDTNDVVLLVPFEGTITDKSPVRNDGITVGKKTYFANGPTLGSLKYIQFGSVGLIAGSPPETENIPERGYLKIQHNSNYDFSGDFTVEFFIKVDNAQDIFLNQNDGHAFCKAEGLKEVCIEYLTSTNQIIGTLHDGTNSVTLTINSAFNLSDSQFRHIALVVNRTTNKARLWLNGIESSALIDISTIGDLTNDGDIFLNAEDISQGFIVASYDNFRICRNVAYNTAQATVLPPALAFIEYDERQLDEFYTDIRIQDDGTGALNRTTMKRIINLMRPTSERLNLIYVRLADDFIQGKGNFLTVQGSSSVNVDTQLVLSQNTIEIIDIINADNFINIYFQASVKLENVNTSGGLIFNYMDSDNYYYFKMSTTTRVFELFKIENGIQTSLSSSVLADIEENTVYILTVTTFLDEFSGSVKLLCYQDRNLIFDVVDNTFNKGRFGFRTEAISTMFINEVEMFEHPLETEQILPGFSG